MPEPQSRFTHRFDPHELRLRLRAQLASGQPTMVPGCTDAMGARLIEEAGFGALYATGAGLANAAYGLPDIGLISLGEVVDHVGRLTEAVATPVIVDADTGYGGPMSAQRTVRLLERAGAAAIQLEDQEMPKRCGHFDTHELIPAEHMQAKIEAAASARTDEALLLIARTDARSATGSIDEAIRRGQLYREAGADVLFIEAPRTIEELRQVGQELAGTPLVVNVVEGGKTPQLSLAEYNELGFNLALYANFLMRAMMRAGRDALTHLHDTGDTTAYQDRIATWRERQDLVGLDEFTAAEHYYDQGWPIREGDPR